MMLMRINSKNWREAEIHLLMMYLAVGIVVVALFGALSVRITGTEERLSTAESLTSFENATCVRIGERVEVTESVCTVGAFGKNFSVKVSLPINAIQDVDGRLQETAHNSSAYVSFGPFTEKWLFIAVHYPKEGSTTFMSVPCEPTTTRLVNDSCVLYRNQAGMTAGPELAAKLGLRT